MERCDIKVGEEYEIYNLPEGKYFGARDGFKGKVTSLHDTMIAVLHKNGSTWLGFNQIKPWKKVPKVFDVYGNRRFKPTTSNKCSIGDKVVVTNQDVAYSGVFNNLNQVCDIPAGVEIGSPHQGLVGTVVYIMEHGYDTNSPALVLKVPAVGYKVISDTGVKMYMEQPEQEINLKGMKVDQIVVIQAGDEETAFHRAGSLGKITWINGDSACSVQVGLSTEWYSPDLLEPADERETKAYNQKVTHIDDILDFDEGSFYKHKDTGHYFHVYEYADDDYIWANKLWPWKDSINLSGRGRYDYIRIHPDKIEAILKERALNMYEGSGLICQSNLNDHLTTDVSELDDWNWDGDNLWVGWHDVRYCVFDLNDEGWAKKITLATKDPEGDTHRDICDAPLGSEFFTVGNWYTKTGHETLAFRCTEIGEQQVMGYGPFTQWKESPWVPSDFAVGPAWKAMKAHEIVDLYTGEMQKKYSDTGFKGIHSNIIITDPSKIDTTTYDRDTNHFTGSINGIEVLICVGNHWAEPHTADGPVVDVGLPIGEPDKTQGINDFLGDLSGMPAIGRNLPRDSVKYSTTAPNEPTQGREKVVNRVIPMLEVKKR